METCALPRQTAKLNQPGDTSGLDSGAQALAHLLQKDRLIDVWWGWGGGGGRSLTWLCGSHTPLFMAGRVTGQEYPKHQVQFLSSFLFNKSNNPRKILRH